MRAHYDTRTSREHSSFRIRIPNQVLSECRALHAREQEVLQRLTEEGLDVGEYERMALPYVLGSTPALSPVLAWFKCGVFLTLCLFPFSFLSLSLYNVLLDCRALHAREQEVLQRLTEEGLDVGEYERMALPYVLGSTPALSPVLAWFKCGFFLPFVFFFFPLPLSIAFSRSAGSCTRASKRYFSVSTPAFSNLLF